MSDSVGLFRRLWLWPLVIAVASAFGLVCALVADDLWDLAGALCLGLPAAISMWIAVKSRRGGAAGEKSATEGKPGSSLESTS